MSRADIFLLEQTRPHGLTSMHALHGLQRIGLFSMEDIARAWETDPDRIRQCPNIGAKGITQIDGAVKRYRLSESDGIRKQLANKLRQLANELEAS